MCTFSVGGKAVSVFFANEPASLVIYLNTVSNEGQQVFKAAQAASRSPFTLVSISDLDWNRDMAPGRVIRSVRHLSDGCVLQGRVHVRFSVVSWFQGVHLLPRAETPAGLHLFLFGGQGGQDPQSGSETSLTKKRFRAGTGRYLPPLVRKRF